LIKIVVCRNKWICHVDGMQRHRLPKFMINDDDSGDGHRLIPLMPVT